MVWFGGDKAKNKDVTESLEPQLKEFLEKQQPAPYIPSSLSEPRNKLNNSDPDKTSRAVQVPAASKDYPLPQESLFPDGRYKEIWKTYVPQAPEATESAAPAQRVMSAKRDRRKMIHQAALENCAFEDELRSNCFTSGDAMNRVRARMTMCRQETVAFNRCYQLQAKFLQALGYLSDANASAADDEKVQMHADKLYHRMMDYELAVDTAKKNNLPIPPLASIFNPNKPAPTVEEINLPEKLERTLKKPLADYAAHERELAARAVLSEASVAQQNANEFFKYTTTLNSEREKRQKLAVNVFGEAIGKFFIPDAPKDHGFKTFGQQELDREFWNSQTDKDRLSGKG